MYRWLRNTHLLLGLFSFAFLMMYGLSAVQMANSSWFNLKPTTTERQLALAPNLGARAAARELMQAHGLRGELTQVRNGEFRIVRPGTVYEVAYAPQTGHTRVRTHTAGFWGMLNRIHHIAGLWHTYPLINVWGALVVVVSLMLITIALTGIYLWFKLHHERRVGSVLLALSLGFGLTLVVLLRTA
jgi:hypothetical protein